MGAAGAAGETVLLYTSTDAAANQMPSAARLSIACFLYCNTEGVKETDSCVADLPLL